jgi:hypothetical protein
MDLFGKNYYKKMKGNQNIQVELAFYFAWRLALINK